MTRIQLLIQMVLATMLGSCLSGVWHALQHANVRRRLYKTARKMMRAMTVTLMLLPTAWGVYELITVVTDAGQQIVSSLAHNSMPAWLSVVAVLLAANVLKLPVSELVH